MIVKPGTALIYANLNEDGDGIYIGDMRPSNGDEACVEVPLKDVPQLVKRLRELQREARVAPEEMAE